MIKDKCCGFSSRLRQLVCDNLFTALHPRFLLARQCALTAVLCGMFRCISGTALLSIFTLAQHSECAWLGEHYEPSIYQLPCTGCCTHDVAFTTSHLRRCVYELHTALIDRALQTVITFLTVVQAVIVSALSCLRHRFCIAAFAISQCQFDCTPDRR